MIPRALIALTALVLTIAPGAAASVPAHLWSRGFGGGGNDGGYDLVLDPSGNLLLLGSFEDAVDLGGGLLVSAGNRDMVLAKFGPAGDLLWSRRYGGAGSETPVTMTLDAAGNVIVAGYFSGTTDLGGGSLAGAGGADVFLAKYSPAGLHQWSLRFGGGDDDTAYGLAVDSTGDIVLGGGFEATVDFGGGGLVSAGGVDVFLAKFDASGNHQWSRRFGGDGNDGVRDLLTDSAGDIVVLGVFYGSADFGGGNLVSNGSADVFLAKYDPDGVHQWSQGLGGAFPELPADLALDSADNILWTGSYSGTVSFGGSPLTSAAFDVVLAKTGPGGAHLWSRGFGGTLNDFGASVAVDSQDHVLISGRFLGTAGFGGATLVGAGQNDAYVAEYDGGGTHLQSFSFGGTGQDDCLEVLAGPAGSLHLTGYFGDTVDFGGGTLYGGGGNDIYVAKLSPAPPAPAITAIEDVGNDQGRRVRIRFDRAASDDIGASNPVVGYAAFRRDDPAPQAGALPLALQGWTEVGSVSAFAEDSYGIEVPTVGDSTVAQGQYLSVFLVRAVTGTPTLFFDSAPDSGYSLDNLAPGVPSNLVLNTGILSWDASAASDFDYFTIYGGDGDDFGAAAVITHTVNLQVDVGAAGYSRYFVTATDFSGNEGDPAALGSATGVGESPRPPGLSVTAFPNPVTAGTVLGYRVPSRGAVTVTVHDLAGRRVATVLDGSPHEAGVHRTPWNGRAADGVPVPAGVYFVTLRQGSRTGSVRVVVLE